MKKKRTNWAFPSLRPNCSGIECSALAGIALLSPVSGDDLVARLDRILTHAAENAQGVVVVLEVGGETIFAEGRGRLHHDEGAPAGPRSVLPAGMLVDFLAALAALRLTEEGKLELTAPIELEGFSVEGATLNVRQLLTHTSGLALPAALPEEDAARRDWSWLTAGGLVFAPDSCQTYCPANTWVVGALVERITERPFAEFVEEEILERAGLRRSGWIEGWGERLDEQGTWVKCAGELAHDPLGNRRFRAGELVVTPADLARLMRAVADGDVVDDLALGRMTGTPRLEDGTPIPYGYGWNRAALDDFECFTLGGSTGHEHLHAAWYPALDLVLALAADSPAHDLDHLERRLVREVFDLVGPSYEDRALPESADALYSGEYRVGCNQLFVSVADGELVVESPLFVPARLAYVGGHQFVARGGEETRVVFQVHADAGRAHALTWISNGTYLLAQRLGDL